jgi:hypothetical protein
MLIVRRKLTNAIYMFFVAPLLAKSQYAFDSAIARGKARIHRYGHNKTVYIYHFVALHTIDVKNSISAPSPQSSCLLH